MLLFRYELRDSRLGTQSVQCSTVNTSAWYRGRKLLRATRPPSTLTASKKRHVCGKLIVGLANSGCYSAPRLNFLNIFKGPTNTYIKASISSMPWDLTISDLQ